jgi:hypothetical protein
MRSLLPVLKHSQFLLLASVVMTACYASTVNDGSPGGASGRPGGSSSANAVPGGASGLPCEVVSALSKCTTCHSATPTSGAPMALVTRIDLMTASAADPNVSNAARCVVRMQDAKSPMPPSGIAAKADVDAVSAWVSAGMPEGSCMTQPAAPDPAFSGPVVCTSGMPNGPTKDGWTMNPGLACNACHAKDAPDKVLAWGGTVYATGHEPDQCVGVGSIAGATVVIADANGTELKLPVNSSGNFGMFADDPKATVLVAPFSARVEQGGKVRAMSRKLAKGEGDCNGCHTVAGTNGAPGRIALP